ncbi:hypothetical protein [Algicola sagamiensis]|uniref:hypothetical protein n=1 Tax=Algicola sagamiensis TaxID=163869 RepID=UPI0003A5ABBF|nr:hypothetical protein [Algicola sagamiensis]
MNIQQYLQSEVSKIQNQPTLQEKFESIQKVVDSMNQRFEPVPIENIQDKEKLFVSYDNSYYYAWTMTVEQLAFQTTDREAMNEYLEKLSQEKDVSITFSDKVSGGSYHYDFNHTPMTYLRNALIGLGISLSALLLIPHLISFLIAGVFLLFGLKNAMNLLNSKDIYSDDTTVQEGTDKNTFADDTTHLCLSQYISRGSDGNGESYYYSVYTLPGKRVIYNTSSRKTVNQLIQNLCKTHQLQMEYSRSVSVRSLDYNLNSPPIYYIKNFIPICFVASIFLIANYPFNIEEDRYLLIACFGIPTIPLIFFLRSLYVLCTLKK